MQSPSTSGTKKDINKYVDFKDIKLTNVKSKLDHGIKNFSSPKIAKDVKPKAEGQASEKNGLIYLLRGRRRRNSRKKGTINLETVLKNMFWKNAREFNFLRIIIPRG